VRLSCVLGARTPTYKREATEDRTSNHKDRSDERDALKEHELVSLGVAPGHYNNAQRVLWVQRCAQGSALGTFFSGVGLARSGLLYPLILQPCSINLLAQKKKDRLPMLPS
jgi:hypothetical protein